VLAVGGAEGCAAPSDLVAAAHEPMTIAAPSKTAESCLVRHECIELILP
jgi:hypothetical protein